MNGYKAFWRGKTTEVHAPTLFQAREQAAEKLGVPYKRAYEVAVVLCEKDGEQVAHHPAEIG